MSATLRAVDPLPVRLFDVIDGCAWNRLPDLFAKECVYERPGYDPIRGIADLLRFYEHDRIISRGHHQLSHLVQIEGLSACWGTFRGVSRNQEPLEEQFADTFELSADGYILRRKTYFFRPAI